MHTWSGKAAAKVDKTFILDCNRHDVKSLQMKPFERANSLLADIGEENEV